MSLNQKKLTKEIKTIKKFARFGLIQITPHAKQRMEERNIDRETVLDFIRADNTKIVQDKPSGTYKGSNENDRFVLYCNKKNQKIHIVIEKGISNNSNYLYRLVTCYKPDSTLFRKDGTLRKKKDRKELDTTYAPAS